MTKTILKKAIDNMCKECTYDNLDRGTWRQQVAACTIHACPLHAVRPVNEKYDGRNQTFLTTDLLKHWNIQVEDLDDRAKSIVKDAPEG